MHALGTVLVTVGILLLLAEAIGERRATRWRQNMKDTDEFGEEFNTRMLGDPFGRNLWRFNPRRVGFFVGAGLASLVARFDAWKARHHLEDSALVLAIVCAAAGITLTILY